MVRDPKKVQRTFVGLFVVVLVMDLLVKIALASGDPNLEAITFLWTGPFDDIFYLLAAHGAFFYLIDPSGSETLDSQCNIQYKQIPSVLKAGGNRLFARNFLAGSTAAVLLLPALLGGSLAVSIFIDTPVSNGVTAFLGQHLGFLLPVSMAVVGGLSFFRLLEHTSTFWRGTAMGIAAVLFGAALDGRWQNHLFHIVANFENIQAWCATIAWAAFFVATREGAESATLEGASGQTTDMDGPVNPLRNSLSWSG